MTYTANYWFDIECYPNFFSLRATRDTDGGKWCFEISEWVNQGKELNLFLWAIAQSGGRMVGYNNLTYDYPMVHLIMDYNGVINNAILYQKSQAIISDFSGWGHMIWDRDRRIPQVDLFKIHHFDNKAKLTSLKLLEFNMRLDSIEELPYDPNYPVTWEQSRHLLEYNDHDVFATGKFHGFSLEMIEFRDELSAKYGKDFTNHNDTKIGADIVTVELEKRGIRVHKSIQTIRNQIRVADIILPYIWFESPEFNQVLNFFRNSVIDPEKMKGFLSGLSATLNGFQFDFGVGGIHGSLHNTVVVPGPDEELIDSDVASYYPNLAIKNRLAPAHLGDGWCDVMQFMYEERLRVGKKTAMGNAYKLALNGSYGKTGDVHSPFFDTQYTLSITINGQLSLCMLAEQLMKIPGLRMVQINTDGLTYVCPKQYVEHAMNLSKWWEDLTKLELEHVNYSKMCIRDVNNYLAVTLDGKVKRIGAYAHVRAEENPATRELPWHKNHGGIVVAKAAEAALVRGENIEQFIRNHVHVDPMDFMFRAKVPRSAKLVGVRDLGWGIVDEQKLPNITRYYVSNSGVELVKIMEPTESMIVNWRTQPHWKHSKTGEHKCAKKAPSGMWDQISRPTDTPPDRRIGIEAGWKVVECNRMVDELSDLNIDYYVTETRKLVDGLIMGS